MRTIAYLLALLAGGCAALAVYGCLLPWRRRRLRRAGLASPTFREGAMALFWMFCGGMAVLTLMPRWVVWSLLDVLHGYAWNGAGDPFFERGTVNLRPFQTFGADPHSLYILAGNVVMFLPFGFFSALLWRGYTWRRSLVTGAAVTICMECWQLLVGRAFDIDDLILNTLGVLAGFWLLRLLERQAPGTVGRFRVGKLQEK